MGLDIEVPPLIKKHLLEDFEQVAEGGKLLPLPRSPCVSEIMERYIAEVRVCLCLHVCVVKYSYLSKWQRAASFCP